jgi:hypothetical protein
MSHRKTVWSVAIVVSVVVLMVAAFAKADVVGGSLLYLDAADANGDGVKEAGSGTAWVNKGSLSSGYNATVGISGNGTATWAGDGTTSNPYALQVRPGSGIYDGGYAQVGGSYTSGNSLDVKVYTYEVWAKINGNGSDGAAGLNTAGGTLMGHNTQTTGQGNGSIGYAVNTDSQSLGFQPNSLYTQSGQAPAPAAYQTAFPNSTDLIGAGYHQIVLARAGSGATDTAWYQDGVLKGTWQTDSNDSVNSWFMIGGRNWSTHYDMFANADISIARVYGTALTAAEVLQNYNADAGRFDIVVPEPCSLVMVVTCLLGLSAYAWRKRK